jgi:hypothetical protein
MTTTTFLSTVAHVAPIIFLLTMVISVGNSRIANYQLNGNWTFGFSLSILFFSLFGVFASVQAGEPMAYAIAYAVFTFCSATVAYRIYSGISTPSDEVVAGDTKEASAPLVVAEKPFAPLVVAEVKEEQVLEPAEV